MERTETHKEHLKVPKSLAVQGERPAFAAEQIIIDFAVGSKAVFSLIGIRAVHPGI